MTSPKIIEGWHRTYDRPVLLPLPSAQESAEFLRRHRDKQHQDALAFKKADRKTRLDAIRRTHTEEINTAIRAKTRDGSPLGTFTGREEESEFAPAPPVIGHRENGFEDSGQCGCKACSDRRKRTSDSKQPIRNIADLNRANKKAFGSR